MTGPNSPTDLWPLVELVRRLRGPGGCPWDQEQGLTELRAYLLEEAHELAAAIDDRDFAALGDELGDLLFQAAFVAHLAAEEGGPGLGEAISRVETKMIARHPHVFGEEVLADAQAVREAWERRKVRAAQGEGARKQGHLAGVASSLPALLAAYRMTQKAAGVGFDWESPDAVLDKVEEEIGELRQALASGRDAAESVRAELGDLLFSLANFARHLGIDPEATLAGANRKFRQRFALIEAGLSAQGKSLDQATLAEMELLWQEAKREVP